MLQDSMSSVPCPVCGPSLGHARSAPEQGALPSQPEVVASQTHMLRAPDPARD